MSRVTLQKIWIELYHVMAVLSGRAASYCERDEIEAKLKTQSLTGRYEDWYSPW